MYKRNITLQPTNVSFCLFIENPLSTMNSNSDRRMVVLKNKSPGERSSQKGFTSDIRNLSRRLAELYALQRSSVGDGDKEMGAKVITLVGENRGATMNLKSSNDGEENYRETLHSKEAQLNAFVNSNVQSANNSILYDSTCAYRDPGAKLSLSNTPKDSTC